MAVPLQTPSSAGGYWLDYEIKSGAAYLIYRMNDGELERSFMQATVVNSDRIEFRPVTSDAEHNEREKITVLRTDLDEEILIGGRLCSAVCLYL